MDIESGSSINSTYRPMVENFNAEFLCIDRGAGLDVCGPTHFAWTHQKFHIRILRDIKLKKIVCIIENEGDWMVNTPCMK